MPLSRQELELGFVFFGGEDEVRGELVATFGNEILDQRGAFTDPAAHYFFVTSPETSRYTPALRSIHPDQIGGFPWNPPALPVVQPLTTVNQSWMR
jgi:hypothetical protein